jgi:hypothetical protein
VLFSDFVLSFKGVFAKKKRKGQCKQWQWACRQHIKDTMKERSTRMGASTLVPNPPHNLFPFSSPAGEGGGGAGEREDACEGASVSTHYTEHNRASGCELCKII